MDLFSLIIGAFAGIIGTFLFYWSSNRRAYAIVNQKNALKGVEKKQEQADRLMAFMQEVTVAFNKSKGEGGKVDVKKFISEEVPPIAVRYPDIVLKFGGKIQKMFENFNSEGLLE